MVKLYSISSDYRELSPIPVITSNFPDGTLNLKVDFSNCESELYGMRVDWRYENDAELFTVAAIVDKIKDYWIDLYIELNMPYIPHARMDRVKEHDDCFTLKSFCKIINSMGFSQVSVLDAHSNVSLALLNNVFNATPAECIKTALVDIVAREAHTNNKDDINKFFQENIVMFYPDEGAMKRYSGMIEHPYTFGIKNRDWKTGKILGLDIVNKDLVAGKNIFIVDDICSRGGTFLHAAEALKAAGAKNIYLFVSHAENTMYTGEMYRTPDLIKYIFTTDSIPTRSENFMSEKVTIYPV